MEVQCLVPCDSAVFQALAETVGSIMGNHVGKGRSLLAYNFSKELFLGRTPKQSTFFKLKI